MKTVTNKTKRPLKISLPGGKKLFLGVTKQAQLRDAALQHPPVQKLIEAGDIEVFDAAATRHGIHSAGTNTGGSGHSGGGGRMGSGDR